MFDWRYPNERWDYEDVETDEETQVLAPDPEVDAFENPTVPGKSGPTFVIPCHRASDLATEIQLNGPKDDAGQTTVEFRHLIRAMSTATHGFSKGVFLICVAPEDFVMWPDGADIRDYQLGGRTDELIIVRSDGVYSNLRWGDGDDDNGSGSPTG